jgi:hypothetical protein
MKFRFSLYNYLTMHYRVNYFLIFILFGIGNSAMAQYTWDGGGTDNNWNNPDNWNPNGVPQNSWDDVIFDGTSTKNCNINVAVSVRSINVNTGYSGTITQVNGNSLTFAGPAASSFNDGSFIGGNSTIFFGSDLSITGGADFLSTSAELRIQGHFDYSSTSVYQHNNGTVNFYQPTPIHYPLVITANANFADDIWNLRFEGSSAQFLVSSPLTANNDFTIEPLDGTRLWITPSQPITVKNDFFMSGTATGNYIWIDNTTINVEGNVTITNTGESPTGGLTGTIVLNGDGDQILSSSVLENQGKLPNITINKTSGTLELAGTLTVSGDWNYLQGDVIANNTSTVVFDESTNTTTIDTKGVASSMSFYDLKIDNNDSHLASDLDVNGDFVIAPGARLFSENFNFSVAGDWTSTGGTFFPFTGTVTFDGTSQQLSTSSDFNNLTMNGTGPAQLTLNTPVNVNTTLTLTNGVIKTSSSNLLTLIDNATVNGGSGISFVDGPMEKIGDDPFTFPIGDAGVYRPLTIADPSSTGAYTAEYFFQPPQSFDSYSPPLEDVSAFEYWDFGKTSGPNVAVTLSWDAAQTPSYDIDDDNDADYLQVVYWNGSSWVSAGNFSSSVTGTGGTVQSGAPISSSGLLTLGSTNKLNTPLPVKFLSFTGDQHDDQVDLIWKVTDVVSCNSCLFTVQRMNREIQFDNIATLDAIQPSRELTYTFNYQDPAPLLGLNYYRIRHVDEGEIDSYSEIIAVRVTSIRQFSVSPNPWNREGLIVLRFPVANQSTSFQVDVFDTIGNHIVSDNVEVAADQTVVSYEPSVALPKGLNVFAVYTNGRFYSARVLVK